jgi:glutathione peroxidase
VIWITLSVGHPGWARPTTDHPGCQRGVDLTEVADAEGHSGDVRWNVEKILIAPDGTITRFSPVTAPDDPALVAAIEARL